MWAVVTLLAAGLAFLAVMMALVWLLSVWLDNAGIVDIAWSAGFVPLTLLYVWMADGWAGRDLLLVGMVGIWGLRLAWHLLVRVARAHPEEDSRYAKLRREWGASANAKTATRPRPSSRSSGSPWSCGPWESQARPRPTGSCPVSARVPRIAARSARMVSGPTRDTPITSSSG
jgi:hypothetical protein